MLPSRVIVASCKCSPTIPSAEPRLACAATASIPPCDYRWRENRYSLSGPSMTHGGTYLQFVENRCDDGIVYNTRKPANHLLGCRAVFQRVSPAVWSPVFQCSLNRNRHGSKATTISSSTVRRIRLRVSMLAAGWRYRRGRSVPSVKIPRRRDPSRRLSTLW